MADHHVLELLAADPRIVRQLFDRWGDAPSAEVRDALALEICQRLTSQWPCEEAFPYPAAAGEQDGPLPGGPKPPSGVPHQVPETPARSTQA